MSQVNGAGMKITVAEFPVDTECERILRTLPQWFGDEAALLEYAKATVIHLGSTPCCGGRTCPFCSSSRYSRPWDTHPVKPLH
jgi:hypothetical protein